jgi:hypothetical protein
VWLISIGRVKGPCVYLTDIQIINAKQTLAKVIAFPKPVKVPAMAMAAAA